MKALKNASSSSRVAAVALTAIVAAAAPGCLKGKSTKAATPASPAASADAAAASESSEFKGEVPPLVSTGNRFTFSRATLQDDANYELIEWRQTMRCGKSTCKEEYAPIPAIVLDGKAAPFTLWVLKSKRDELLQRCEKDTAPEDCVVTVDKSFMYGQDKSKTFRFLVFHDPDMTPYQHRFGTSKYLTALAKFVTKHGESKMASAAAAAVPYGDQLLKISNHMAKFAPGFAGDYLRSFE